MVLSSILDRSNALVRSGGLAYYVSPILFAQMEWYSLFLWLAQVVWYSPPTLALLSHDMAIRLLDMALSSFFGSLANYGTLLLYGSLGDDGTLNLRGSLS